MPQHFVASPEWHWYIVWYFFLGGIAGGAYALGTLLRLVGIRRTKAPRARLSSSPSRRLRSARSS